MSALTRLRCLGTVPNEIVIEYYTQRATKGGLLVSEGIHPSLMVRHLIHIYLKLWSLNEEKVRWLTGN